MAQKVYNIKNDVIHYWNKKCITSKRCYTPLPQKVYNIENDVIATLLAQKCITLKMMLAMHYIATKSV